MMVRRTELKDRVDGVMRPPKLYWSKSDLLYTGAKFFVLDAHLLFGRQPAHVA
jgi:hypothetical protein